jgi:hypothetical protein
MKRHFLKNQLYLEKISFIFPIFVKKKKTNIGNFDIFFQ